MKTFTPIDFNMREDEQWGDAELNNSAESQLKWTIVDYFTTNLEKSKISTIFKKTVDEKFSAWHTKFVTQKEGYDDSIKEEHIEVLGHELDALKSQILGRESCDPMRNAPSLRRVTAAHFTASELAIIRCVTRFSVWYNQPLKSKQGALTSTRLNSCKYNP